MYFYLAGKEQLMPGHREGEAWKEWINLFTRLGRGGCKIKKGHWATHDCIRSISITTVECALIFQLMIAISPILPRDTC